ncbi:hypothetical protein HZB02_04125 [Candidatus Woesearchaeota archaeon]|nr:hypothetical protein [Candidatus Woesearchaeota archaeon]
MDNKTLLPRVEEIQAIRRKREHLRYQDDGDRGMVFALAHRMETPEGMSIYIANHLVDLDYFINHPSKEALLETRASHSNFLDEYNPFVEQKEIPEYAQFRKTVTSIKETLEKRYTTRDGNISESGRSWLQCMKLSEYFSSITAAGEKRLAETLTNAQDEKLEELLQQYSRRYQGDLKYARLASTAEYKVLLKVCDYIYDLGGNQP